MAFFEIEDPKYNSDQIELEVLAFLNNRKIPYEQDSKNFEKYNQQIKFINSNDLYPVTQFKILFNDLSRWTLRIHCQNRLPAFFMKRWDEQIQRDLMDIVLKDQEQDSLEPRHLLEYLLYDRFRWIKHIEAIEIENREMHNHIDKLHKTWSWQITALFRNVKKILKRLVEKDS